jgi:hypothetical protein
VWSGALAARPEPKVVTAVAASLGRVGRRDDARGLLEIAWLQLPGDRMLTRARRTFGLPTALQEGVPPEAGRWPALPLTLAGAREAGAVLAAEEAATLAALHTALAGDTTTAVHTLLTLKHGELTAFPADAEKGLAEDLQALDGPNPPEWLPAAARDEVAAAPALRAWAASVAAAAAGG